ncbi:LOW QUALITY PROTEIN: mitochondrial cardiolipin hydrolase [Manacus vitellinus]|uniref:LOW QUALITY PROTEIN: mitochondrial cardiolipin hydrolase n=1 Tax=Manacus vitellinus TaxID=328815 RepID=UPI00115F2CFD|nr:LOW QUALITY PROTEIN: mitochondrial cardiolipin hydrolase [Manacus vitellinus]
MCPVGCVLWDVLWDVSCPVGCVLWDESRGAPSGRASRRGGGGGAALGGGWRWQAWRRRRPLRGCLFLPPGPACLEALLAEAAAPGRPPMPCPCPLPRAETSLSRLVRRLLSARRSLDLCIFAFSCPQLARAVSCCTAARVRVRLVTDAQYMGLHGSQIGRLRHAGIQVRHDQHSGFMHHKFAIVDRRMLITGSLNWTTQAIQSNRENVLVVDDAACVKPFLDEFERIWEEYNPTNYVFPKVSN